MSNLEMQAELERLRAENAQLKSKDKGGITLKVSEKGAVSLYGMGAFRSRFTRSNGSVFWETRRRLRRSFATTNPG
jgi:hypothetical protein